MLWPGQEIVENYDVPESGPARIGTLRPVRWERFYDDMGKSMIWLFCLLIALRRDEPVFRHGSYYFFNNWDHHQWRGLGAFRTPLRECMGFGTLNFSEYDHDVDFTFTDAGDYYEQLHGHDNLLGVYADNTLMLRIPAHYGRVWLTR